MQFVFFSILKIRYVELRISRSVSEGPFNFEITRVDCISDKIEVVKHLHAVFLQENSVNDDMISPTSNQIVDSHGLFDVIDITSLDVVIGMQTTLRSCGLL